MVYQYSFQSPKILFYPVRVDIYLVLRGIIRAHLDEISHRVFDVENGAGFEEQKVCAAASCELRGNISDGLENATYLWQFTAVITFL